MACRRLFLIYNIEEAINQVKENPKTGLKLQGENINNSIRRWYSHPCRKQKILPRHLELTGDSFRPFFFIWFFLRIPRHWSHTGILVLFSIAWQFVMERLTPQQRLQIVQLYYGNQRSVRNVFRAIRGTYDAHNRPTETTIGNTFHKFESMSLMSNPKSTKSYHYIH